MFLRYESLHHLLHGVQHGMETYLFTSVATSKCTLLTIDYDALEDYLIENEETLKDIEESEVC